jgi:hypothetical protein
LASSSVRKDGSVMCSAGIAPVSSTGGSPPSGLSSMKATDG